MRALNLFIKRIIDIVGSLVGIVLLSPVFLIIAILIKLTSLGPVFFLQERLGKNGKVFRIIKFRTMVVNAEKMGDGLSIRSESDQRITKIGKFLRASSLDELPQLFNVLKGEMSLVGPRPPVPYHPYKYEDYSDEQRMRFSMKPGVTGLSQVMVRNSVGWDVRIEIDLQYIRRFTIFMDIKIIMLTVLRVFFRKDIY